MKKISNIIILILSLLLFTNINVYAASCEDLNTNIDAGQDDCKSPCKWSFSKGCYTPEENNSSCASITSDTTCNNTSGCEWNRSYSKCVIKIKTENGANGKVSVSRDCSSLSESACNSDNSCTWNKTQGCINKTASASNGSNNNNSSSNNNSSNSDSTYETCGGLLGSFADDLEDILKAMRIIAPILVLALSTYEYITVVLSKDADSLKKANSKLIKRLVLMLLLFFLPTIINLFIHLMLGSDYSTCIS